MIHDEKYRIKNIIIRDRQSVCTVNDLTNFEMREIDELVHDTMGNDGIFEINYRQRDSEIYQRVNFDYRTPLYLSCESDL